MKRIIFLLLSTTVLLILNGCHASDQSSMINGLHVTGQMQLDYAAAFSVDYCEGGYSCIHIGEEDYLLVPEGKPIPEANQMTVIQQPVSHIYAASSAVMDLFDAIGGLDAVEMTSTDYNNWSLPHIQEAMQNEKLLFIGKYSAPDYEALLESDCGLAIENTMIYHSPAVKEQIESLGIPVLVERSSYESHPLGRMEWLKLYGLLLDKEEAAAQYFEERTADFRELLSHDIPDAERPSVAFFSITANGYVNIRKPGDYISQMIRIAGGNYIFHAEDLNIDENALSTMNIQMETFYQTAKDADILIYNSTIEGELAKIDDLLQKNSLFREFRAVQNHNVWCTGQNCFQQTTGAADMITDLNRIFTGQAADVSRLTYLHQLQ